MESPVLTGIAAPLATPSQVLQVPHVRLADGSRFPAARRISILDAALQARLTLDHSCRTGRCGACKTQVISGHTQPLRAELAIAPAEARDGWILTCAREALTDTELSAEAIPGPPPPTPRTLPCRVESLERAAPDVLRVRLEVDAQRDMSWVVVSDPVPGGALILGSGLGRDSAIATSGEKRAGTAWPAFEERSFEAFRSYYEYLPRGKHVIEYSVRLNNPGKFALPPTRVEAMYAPESFGELPNAALEVGP